VVPDHLNEALMNLLQACAEGKLTHHVLPQRIMVETLAREDRMVIRIGYKPAAADVMLTTGDASPDFRFDSARRRVVRMGGHLSLTQSTIELSLPMPAAQRTAG
jgi:hypothetical protein